MTACTRTWAAFSSRAITDDGKIYDCQYEESAVRQAMLRSNADKKIFLCSANKVSTVSNYLQCTLAQIDYLVCEKDLSSKFKNSFPNVSFI